MNFPYGLLPAGWHWLSAVLYLAIIVPVIWRAPWHWLRDTERLHVYLGSCVVLLLLWSIRSTAIPGLEYHYLGATLLTLMFGWRLASVAISVVLIGTIINGTSDWQSYSMNVLVMGVFPVLLSHAIHRAAEALLPLNVFVYIFVCAFFGAAIALVAASLLAAALLSLGGVYTTAQLLRTYFPIAPLLAFPEAFITGTLITMMVAMKPRWLMSFDDERYLKGK